MSIPYMISYEMKHRGREYFEIYKIIQSFGGNALHLQDCLWLVQTDETPDSMYQKLSPIFGSNDSLFICELNSNYQGLASPDEWHFIQEQAFN